jgi:hypothetical protein
MCRSIALGLMILSIILMVIGGFADMHEDKHILGLSKQQYWSDGIFLLVFSGWLVLWNHTERV